MLVFIQSVNHLLIYFQVREAQPMVDTKAPATYMHLHLKLKKLQVSFKPTSIYNFHMEAVYVTNLTSVF